MSRTYNDPVKEIARSRWKSFLQRHVLTRRKPRDVRVVCFPGAEVEGEEALEVKEIYDPLGIPRGNIVGLEYDSGTAKRLELAKLGIQVVNKKDAEFFASTQETFDVISLDYTGPQTIDAVNALDAIAGRHILAPWGVLHTNYLGQRETKRLQERMQGARLWKMLSLSVNDRTSQLVDEQGLSGYLKNQMALEKKPELEEARNAITEETLASLNAGSFSWMPFPNIFSGTPQHDKWVEEMAVENGVKPNTKGMKVIEQTYFMEATAKLIRTAEQRRGISSAHLRSILTLIHGAKIDPYNIEALERYSYVSNKGSHMLTDFIATRPFSPRIRKLVPKVARLRNNILDVSPRKGLKQSKFEKILTEFSQYEAHLAAPHYNLPEREFLGSSCVRKQKISKYEAIGLLREGLTPAEIEGRFSGFKKMQLAAFKAHYITMGKTLSST